jgi:hypothetical protein
MLDCCFGDFLGNDVPNNEENAKLCTCPTCPTYKKSNLTNTIFCARGKTEEKATAAAVCVPTAQSKKYSLDQMYYCIKGKSAEIQS